jgi:hypothetical protein
MYFILQNYSYIIKKWEIIPKLAHTIEKKENSSTRHAQTCTQQQCHAGAPVPMSWQRAIGAGV